MVELGDINPEQQRFIRFAWLHHGLCFFDGEPGFKLQKGYCRGDER